MIYSLLDSSKELTNRRAIRREKNTLHNKKNELEETLMNSLMDNAEKLSDKTWDNIEDAIEVIDDKIYELEKALKNKSYK